MLVRVGLILADVDTRASGFTTSVPTLVTALYGSGVAPAMAEGGHSIHLASRGGFRVYVRTGVSAGALGGGQQGRGGVSSAEAVSAKQAEALGWRVAWMSLRHGGFSGKKCGKVRAWVGGWFGGRVGAAAAPQ